MEENEVKLERHRPKKPRENRREEAEGAECKKEHQTRIGSQLFHLYFHVRKQRHTKSYERRKKKENKGKGKSTLVEVQRRKSKKEKQMKRCNTEAKLEKETKTFSDLYFSSSKRTCRALLGGENEGKEMVFYRRKKGRGTSKS